MANNHKRVNMEKDDAKKKKLQTTLDEAKKTSSRRNDLILKQLVLARKEVNKRTIYRINGFNKDGWMNIYNSEYKQTEDHLNSLEKEYYDIRKSYDSFK